MKPSCACELAERALENYHIIKRKEDDGEEAFATVAALSATLFCIIMFREKGMLDNVHITEEKIENLPTAIQNALNAEEKFDNTQIFIIIIKLMRHSLAHSSFKFTVDKNDRVYGINFYLKDAGNKQNKKTFEKHPNLPENIHLSENELVSLLKVLTQLFKKDTSSINGCEIVEKITLNKKDTAS